MKMDMNMDVNKKLWMLSLWIGCMQVIWLTLLESLCIPIVVKSMLTLILMLMSILIFILIHQYHL